MECATHASASLWLLIIIQYHLNECTNATESQLVHTTSEKKVTPPCNGKTKANDIFVLITLQIKSDYIFLSGSYEKDPKL